MGLRVNTMVFSRDLVGSISSFPYILCNEQDQRRLIASLPPKPPELTMAHLGFAGWLNLDIIAKTNPTEAYLCDINTDLLRFFQEYVRNFIRQAPNRFEFVNLLINNLPQELLKSVIRETEDGYLYAEDALRYELHRPEGWLSSDERYETVRNLYQNNVIYHLFLNALDQQTLQREFRGKTFHTIYTSNIYEWIRDHKKSDLNQFTGNMQDLLSESTYYIDAFYRTTKPDHLGPPLRMVQGHLPDYNISFSNRKSRSRL